MGTSPPWILRAGSWGFTPSWAGAASASKRRLCSSLLAPWHSDILRITSNLGVGFATGMGARLDPVSAFSVCEPARDFSTSNRSGFRNLLTFSPQGLPTCRPFSLGSGWSLPARPLPALPPSRRFLLPSLCPSAEGWQGLRSSQGKAAVPFH